MYKFLRDIDFTDQAWLVKFNPKWMTMFENRWSLMKIIHENKSFMKCESLENLYVYGIIISGKSRLLTNNFSSIFWYCMCYCGLYVFGMCNQYWSFVFHWQWCVFPSLYTVKTMVCIAFQIGFTPWVCLHATKLV